jgi:hypothetical protein
VKLAPSVGAAGSRVFWNRASPDYDASDEIEFFFRYLPWGLRGVVDGNGYPPPAYPPV